MVKVNAPRAIAPGMRRFGISAARNTAIATGSITNATTNKETPPYVKIAQVNTTESTARLFPNFKVQNCAIDCAFPEISINFAKTAPNR